MKKGAGKVIAPTPFLFVTYSTGLKGHGVRYVSELMSRIARRGRLHPVIMCPEGFRGKIVSNSTNFEIEEVPGLEFSRMEASRFQKYGKIAPLIRGFVRRGLCHDLYAAMFRYLEKHPEILLVHAEEYEYFHLARVWRFLGKRAPNVKKVITLHLADFAPGGWSIPETYKRMVRNKVREIVKLSDCVQVHGKWIAEAIPDQLSLDLDIARRIHVTQYGAEERDFRIGKEEARQKLGVPPDVPVVLWFGMVRKDKRPDVAITAAGDARKDLWLIFAGTCESLSREQIYEWVGKAGIAKRSILRLEYVSEEDIPVYFSASDLFLSTHWGGYGATSGPLNDCRTYRLPVIASDCGELGYYVRENGLGLTARPDDAHDFAKKINEFFGWSIEKRKEINVCLETAAQKYSWENMSLKLEEIYLHAMGLETGSPT